MKCCFWKCRMLIATHRSSCLQMFFKIGFLKNLAIFTGKRPVLESLFIKKRLQLRSFPVNTAKFLRTAFTILYRTCLVAASELKSNVSNTNLHKNKQKLFLYFHNSHANQKNTTKKIRFFLIHY